MSAGFHRLGSRAAQLGYSANTFPTRHMAAERGEVSEAADNRPTRIEREAPLPAAEFEPGPVRMTRDQALLSGFTGNVCVCGSMMMVRNGTCEKCQSCGETTGCS